MIADDDDDDCDEPPVAQRHKSALIIVSESESRRASSVIRQSTDAGLEKHSLLVANRAPSAELDSGQWTALQMMRNTVLLEKWFKVGIDH